MYFCPDSSCKDLYLAQKPRFIKANWKVVGMSYGNKYKVYLKPENESNINRHYKNPPKKFIPFRPQQGYVYLMQAENGIYKIGMAKNVEDRRKSLEREIPLKMKVIHYFFSENCRKAERHLHTVYADLRLRYEWFTLSDEHVSMIIKIGDFGLDKELGIA
jgi:hypothetical protein